MPRWGPGLRRVRLGPGGSGSGPVGPSPTVGALAAVPVTVTASSGLGGASLVMRSVAVEEPGASGAKRIANWHVPATGTAAPVHASLVIRKSLGFAPMNVRLVTCSAPSPVLVSVTVFGLPIVVAGWVEKLSVVGLGLSPASGWRVSVRFTAPEPSAVLIAVPSSWVTDSTGITIGRVVAGHRRRRAGHVVDQDHRYCAGILHVPSLDPKRAYAAIDDRDLPLHRRERACACIGWVRERRVGAQRELLRTEGRKPDLVARDERTIDRDAGDLSPSG